MIANLKGSWLCHAVLLHCPNQFSVSFTSNPNPNPNLWEKDYTSFQNSQTPSSYSFFKANTFTIAVDKTQFKDKIIHNSRTVTAAAAKSLQSCPTLCNPIDGNLPVSPVPGILQARTLEWIAISFSNAWKWKVKVTAEHCAKCGSLPDVGSVWLSGCWPMSHLIGKEVREAMLHYRGWRCRSHLFVCVPQVGTQFNFLEPS